MRWTRLLPQAVLTSVQFNYAYIDRMGKVVIDAHDFCRATGFSEGLAAVCDARNRWGFIDKRGAFVIPPQFDGAYIFRENLALVQLDGKYGFIDKQGTLVIKNQFEWVAGFSEGVAVVKNSTAPPKPVIPAGSRIEVHIVVETWNLTDPGDFEPDDDEYALIDTAGNLLTVFDSPEVQVNIDDCKVSEGLLTAYSRVKDAVGFINTSGEFVIEPKFVQAARFSEGLARVAVAVDDEERLAFIDKKGEFVIPPRFNTDFDFVRNSTNFSEGLASVSEGLNPTLMNESTFVYIDKRGEIALATEFFYAAEFCEGLAAVYDAELNRWGFINKSGTLVIPLQYEIANEFSDGLALVMFP